MEGADEARRQREQLARYLAWVREEGGSEGPGHLNTWFKPHQRQRLQWLKDHCIGTVLELGCNYGYVLAYCGGRVGVDWNARSIALARILSPEREFVVADIRQLPFPDSHVDTVMVSDILEHLDWADVPRAIAEAKRVARHRILITVPNGTCDIAEATNFKHRFLFTKERRRGLVRMLQPWHYYTQVNEHFVLIIASRRAGQW